MLHKHHPKTLLLRLKKLPKKWYGIAGIVLLLLWYGLAFGLKQSVQFSYAGDSCVNRLTVLPQLQRSPSGAAFAIETSGGIDWLLATKVCAVPSQAPQKGAQYAALALWGGWLFRQQFTVHVPAAPQANTAALRTSISTTRTLKLPLSHADSTFAYTLKLADKQAKCRVDGTNILCDVAALKLAQGTTYQAELLRTFASSRVSLAKQQVTTLPAVTLVQYSVQPQEVVYAKPREFTLTLDKPLEKADGQLVKIVDGMKEAVPAKLTHEDATVRMTVDGELPRDTQYELQLTMANARDGSGLEAPVVVPFRTSGGPKPTGVSASGQSVAPGATVTITLDQDMSPSQDVAKLVHVTGSPATVTRTTNQLRVALSAPKCADVTITIDKGLLSTYDVVTTDTWSHSFRTVCYTTSTIGYSAKGRAIQAYHFGNGGEAILFVGAIHGNEQSSSLILQDLVKDLDARARLIPANRQVVVVPTLNPDGYVANTRNNSRNVNLNRNFATSDWTKDLQDTNGAVPGGGGPVPMSEPETLAIAKLSQQLAPRFVLSYHAVGSVVIGNLAGDSATRATRYASQVGYRNGTGQDAEIFDYAITGTYDDWLAQKLGVPSMIIELGSYTYRDYSYHKQAMWDVIAN